MRTISLIRTRAERISAIATLWRMRDLFHCEPCTRDLCTETCRCPHHDDVGALSAAIEALGRSPAGSQVFRPELVKIRLQWVKVEEGSG